MLGIAGIVVLVVMTIQTFKTARNNERNAALWAIAAVSTGVAFQFVIPFFAALVLAVIVAMKGTTDPMEMQSAIIGPANIIGIVCLVLSVVGMWLIFKHVSKVPDMPLSTDVPPPPSNFE